MFRMILVTFAIGCSLFDAVRTDAAPKNGLSDVDKKAILTQSFTTIKSVRKIPKPFIDAIVRNPGDMSDPGGPFSPGCDSYPSVPHRRLVFAAASHDYCIVQAESGGIVYTKSVTILRLVHGKAKLIASLYPPKMLTGLTELRELIRKNQLKNSPF